jgi:uncharacterized protein
VNRLAQELGVAFNTVKLWLEALARLYLLFELRPYSGRLGRLLRREAKVYLFDPTEIPDTGARFENVVALHLKKLCDAWNDTELGDFELRYLRDKEKREVDFVITERQKPWLFIETKLADPTPTKALRYFAERVRLLHGAVQLLRNHAQPYRREGVLLLPATWMLARV